MKIEANPIKESITEIREKVWKFHGQLRRQTLQAETHPDPFASGARTYPVVGCRPAKAHAATTVVPATQGTVCKLLLQQRENFFEMSPKSVLTSFCLQQAPSPDCIFTVDIKFVGTISSKNIID